MTGASRHDERAVERRPGGPYAPEMLLLGRYRLRRLLGSGGSAQVWLALDERLGRPIALKLLHPHLLPDPGTRDRFAAEARAAASVGHPGIVGVHDVVIDGRTAAIVLEYVEGESLEARLRRRGRLGALEAADVAAQIAEALAAAHAAGLVHRDVKPGNVLLDAHGRARLADFGIAQALDEAKAGPRRAEVVGTLRSLSPEQLAGAPGSPAGDLYALGTVLYEMLGGRPPYDATTPAVLADQQRRPPAPIPDAPPGLAALVLWCLQPDPAARPASATDVAAYLRGWLAAASPASGPGGVRLPTSPAGARAAAEAPTLAARFDPAARTLGRPPERRGWAATLALGLSLLALFVVAALALGPMLLRAAGSPAPTGSIAAAAAGSASPPRSSPRPTAPPTPPPTPSPSPSPSPSPQPSPSPSPTPVLRGLTIVDPPDGYVSSARQVDVSGAAPPGSLITRDVAFFFDDHTQADANGDWRMRVTLNPGPNVLTFRLGNDRSTDQQITVYYQP